MKKRLFSILAMTTMLFMASCSEEDLASNAGGEESVVRFSIGLEGGLTTRALANQEKISDGKGADQLMYAVFNEKGDKVLIDKVTENGVTFDPAHTVDLKLAKNQTYQVVFWAQNSECSAYTVSDDMNVSVSYNGVVNNDEKRDAFFKSHTVKVTGAAQTEDVVLKRPFAQLNVGVTDADWQNAMISGIEIESSKVTVNNVANSLNLLTGAVSGAETIEFGLSAIPASLRFNANDQREKQLVVKDDQGNDVAYKYLSMTYLLVNDGSSVTGASKATLSELAFTFHPKSGNDIVFKEGLNNVVPVQRNWRTNIIGQILTGNVTFKITIDQDYDGEYNYPDYTGKGVKIGNSYYETLEEALKAAKDNDVINLSAGEYEFPNQISISTSKAVNNTAKTITFVGVGEGSILSFSSKAGGADGGLNCYADGLNLKFKGLKIVSPNTGSAYSGGFGRARSVLFDNCKYVGQYRSCGPTQFTNCEIDPQTSYIYTDYYNVDFESCIFNASEGKAIQVYNDGNVTETTININNCTFTAAKVGYTWDNKPVTAIDINSNGEKFIVNINNTTATGFGTGIYSNSNLWNIKGGTEYVTLSINGKQIIMD